MDCKGVRNVREKGRNEFLCESQIVSVFSFYFFIFKLTSQRNASSRVVHTYDASISASTKKVSVNRDDAITSISTSTSTSTSTRKNKCEPVT